MSHWQNVTPPGMPAFGRVSLIEASPHNPGGAYVAVKNYQNDDRKPYLFKTENHGLKWEPLANDLPADGPVHVIRCDPRMAVSA